MLPLPGWAESSAARPSRCGRVSYRSLDLEVPSRTSDQAWGERCRCTLCVFTELLYASLLVFPTPRGCAQCAYTLNISIFVISAELGSF